MKSAVEVIDTTQKKVCPECGEPIEEHIESHLMECDRCLAKKEE